MIFLTLPARRSFSARSRLRKKSGLNSPKSAANRSNLSASTSIRIFLLRVVAGFRSTSRDLIRINIHISRVSAIPPQCSVTSARNYAVDEDNLLAAKSEPKVARRVGRLAARLLLLSKKISIFRLMKRKTRAWMEVAESDLSAAESLFRKGYYLHTVFLCHQSVEKFLKALVQERTNEIPKFTHDFALLMQQSKITFTANVEESILRLAPHYLGTRYPEEIAKFREYYDRAFARKCLEDTKRIVRWLRENYLR